jgi:alanyl-tRNA synthetase
LESLKHKHKAGAAGKLIETARSIEDVSVVSAKVEAGDPKELRTMADSIRAKLGSGIVILGSRSDSKAFLLAAVTKDLTRRFSAGEIIKRLAPVIGGKGGGRADLAQAGGPEPEHLDDAIDKAFKTVQDMAGA